ncbi:MAG TPA: 16S rRNA (guanine(966)-N(2))-methyltransferase RsmD [Bryobacteraceae bacterium]|nr:16S rRNA (guanine(966)-N(2))-methyltransferase RsmD [Bryobacteraceae bacterium]
MRVIAGELRSRRLKGVPGLATRPTPDRLRETLFDILGPRTEGAAFADVYAGTGSVGIEALSRGARHGYFLERNRAALAVLRENLAALGLEARATVVPGRVALTLPQIQADIVFLDPPYDYEGEYTKALQALSQAAPKLVIVQHSVRFQIGTEHGPLREARRTRQGDNVLSFFEPV